MSVWQMKAYSSDFEVLKTPRSNRKKIYPLIESIPLALYGVLIGFSDITNMGYYLKKRKIGLATEFRLPEGVLL